jgi:demethylmenaquinone methyltransferase/2-methoxy-6-polyprenyl-1,4-benzoquinol methylase
MIDHFSILAPFYDRLIGSPNTDNLKTILNLPTNGWILDAGGGTGRVASHLGEGARGVILCDLSHPMLKQSAEKNGVLPVNSTVDRLPFADNSIDRIIVVDALHHFKQAQRAIRELMRVLKPGGRLVVEEFDIGTLFVKFIALAEKMLLMGSHFYSPEEITQMATSPESSVNTVRNGRYSVWIVIDKHVES